MPAWLAFAVVRLLERHFARLVDYNFTAGMEDVLDEVAAGRRDSTAELAEFYFGSGDHEGLKSLVNDLGEIDARELSTFRIDDDLAVRVGRYGPYVETADGSRANVPEDLPPDELTVEKARELLANPAGAEIELGTGPGDAATPSWPRTAGTGRTSPRCCRRMRPRAPSRGRRRCSRRCRWTRSTSSRRCRCSPCPARSAADPETGEVITAQNGRYGPYLKKGTDSRSIDSEEQLLTITLDEALAIYAQPKQRGRRAAAAPLKELGPDPTTALPVVVKDGRFGPYVTDGEVNATLRRGDEVETLTLERAAELLSDKRAKGPTPKKTTAKRGAKKSAAKKTGGQEGRRQEDAPRRPRPPRPPRRRQQPRRRPPRRRQQRCRRRPRRRSES